MKLFKQGKQATVIDSKHSYQFEVENWDELINRDNLHDHLIQLTDPLTPVELQQDFLTTPFDPPMDNQEVWAAGVTYLKSKTARMEEAKEAGGDLFYDKVYEAPRPEIFFKAGKQRTVGHKQEVYIRRDSTWDVPEPELTLLINSIGEIQAYTIGNDMSSRSIEGENPLYLPQAKVFEKCAALGPCLYVPKGTIATDATIHLQIFRGASLMFEDQVSIDRMKRTHQELVNYLFMECSFPSGVFLMTGTCLVPPNEFTLRPADRIVISIDHIGQLENTVAQKQ